MINGNLSKLFYHHCQTGRRRAYDHTIINGIIFVLITGYRWKDIPKIYGSLVTAMRRLRHWSSKKHVSNLRILINHTTTASVDALETYKLS
ncbi:transposase [Methanohalophilus sp.]|uniref:transposase n=1 Tax=Methanohalophilus sp. TaxID=1966352 RepID=UPI00341D3853